MKKWFIAIIICLFVIIIAIPTLIPLGLGLIAEHKYSQVLHTWSQSENVKISLVSYKRGWYHSNAVVQVNLKYPTLLQINRWLGNETDDNGIQLTINQRIDHGPLLWLPSQSGKNHLSLGRAAVNSTTNTPLGSVSSTTVAQLDGSLLSVFNAPHLQLANAGKSINAAITGLTATLLLSADLNQMFTSIDVPQATITTPEFLQQINNLSEQFSLRKSPSGLFLGWRTTKIANTSWQTTDRQYEIALNGITMQSQSAEQDAKITYKLNTILDKLQLDNESYGPQQIKFTMSQLDVPTLIALRKELTQISGTEALSATQLLHYNDLFMILLGKGIELNVDKLSLELASGNLLAAIHLLLKPQTTTATSFASLLPYLDAKVNMRAADQVLTQLLIKFKGTVTQLIAASTGTTTKAESEQQAQQQIATWVQNKWLIPEDHTYITHINYQNNQLTINGNEVNPKPNTASPENK